MTATNRKDGEWLAESLRMTVLLMADGDPAEISSWWGRVMPEPPEQSVRRPVYSDVGSFGKGRITLNVNPLRVDWLYTPTPAPLGEDGFQNLGSLKDAIDQFRPAMAKWLGLSPAIARLAFGAVLWRPVKDKLDGYHTIAVYLPAVTLDGSKSSDFLYQINRPRRSKIPNLEINRLSKWMVGQIQSIIVSGTPGAVPVTVLGAAHHGCRLELDINTSADYQGLLPQQEVQGIFGELVTLAEEIAEKGDIP
jgi:hypothetical protein